MLHTGTIPRKRTIAIGDIHGCRRALSTLLHEIDPQPDDTIITLGDYVDRGPDSFGVIECLLGLRERCRLIALRGNHEEIMLDARLDWSHFGFWQSIGGDVALMSYARDPDFPSLADIPSEHWDFIEQQCIDFAETDQFIFVHAGVAPDQPMDRQLLATLRWKDFPPASPHISGKTIICGHTTQRNGEPRSVGHAICIDTGAGIGGVLTALDVDAGHYWQAGEDGFRGIRSLAAPKRRW